MREYDYRVEALLHQVGTFQYYQGINVSNQMPVILKTYRDSYVAPGKRTGLETQYDVSCRIQSPHFVKPRDLCETTLGPTLVFPALPISPLTRVFPDGVPDTERLMLFSKQMALALMALHGEGMQHGPMVPGGIWINSLTNTLLLLGFDDWQVWHQDAESDLARHSHTEILSHSCPEYLGLSHQITGVSPDVYSLGTLFYYLAAGRPPFVAESPSDFYHHHMAIVPPTLRETNCQIPLFYSQVTAKLLEKSPSRRYQSVEGLFRDLEAFERARSEGQGDTFSLALVQRHHAFAIPKRLFGRDREIRVIRDQCERVFRGDAGLISISGYSGIGKTSLARDLESLIAENHGFLISGKFDQNQRNQPYASLIEAFQELTKVILSASEEALQRWRTHLNQALYPNGRVITEVIPEMEIVLGPQPAIPQLAGGEAQNRFNLVFQTFVRHLCGADHPIVVFLDDLQWADMASLNLLDRLVTDPEMHHFLVILAYRDNEVSANHPLKHMFQKIEAGGVPIHDVHLRPLAVAEVNQLVAETVALPLEKAAPLSDLIYQKTEGNPFFTIQLLKALHDEGVIFFQESNGRWAWDLERIKSARMADNVVDLMISKIKKLPDATQAALVTASSIGNQLSLATLAVVEETSRQEVFHKILPAVCAGFLLLLSDGEDVDSARRWVEDRQYAFKFLHDRVQQAAYQLNPDACKKEIHLKIGRILLANTPDAQLDGRIFEIVNQINVGADLITDPGERIRLAALNLAAARKAKTSTAFQSSLSYLRAAKVYLGEDAWQDHYELSLDIHTALLNLLYLNDMFAEAAELMKILLSHARTLLDKIPVYEANMLFCIGENLMQEAISGAIDALTCLGVPLRESFPALAPPASLQEDGGACLSFADLYDLDDMTDADKRAALHILRIAGSPAYLTSPDTFRKVCFTMVDLCIEFGNCEDAAYAYAVLGLALCGDMHQTAAAYEYGRLGLRILDKYDGKEIKAQIYEIFNVHIRHWKEPARASLNPMIEGVQAGLEVGGFEFASYNAAFYCSYILFVGRHLNENWEQQKKYLNLLTGLKQEFCITYAKIWHQATGFLIEGPLPDFRIEGEVFHEDRHLPVLKEKNNLTSLYSLYLSKGILATYFGNPAAALEFLNEAESYSGGVVGMINVWQHCFYKALALLSLHRFDEGGDLIRVVEARDLLAQLYAWSAECPANFENKAALVAAELARVEGRMRDAMTLFDKAIELALDEEFLPEAALACERAALFYLSQGHYRFTDLYVKEAAKHYASWGARAKLAQLDNTFGTSLSSLSMRLKRSESDATDKGELADGGLEQPLTLFDLMAIMQASQAISGEILLEPLLETFLEIAARNAGAQRGFIILQRDGHLCFDEAIAMGSEVKSSDEPLPFAQSIALYVARAKEKLVLDDAANHPRFLTDPYIATHQPKSVLCDALCHKDKFFGVIYLENNLVKRCFTEERVYVLRLLMAQAVISIENAELYGDMEAQVEKRTQELRETQDQLVHSGKMAAIGELATGVAHELNQPLAFIRGGAQLELMNLGMDLVDQESIRETFSNIVMGTDRMMKIVNHLRDFSRMTGEDVPIPVNLHQVLENSLLMTGEQFKQHNIRIVRNFAGDSLVIHGIAHKLEQVFINLICNARDALEGRADAALTITTHWGTSGDLVDSAVIEFADNGAGIHPECMEKIFHPFFTTKQKGKGTGLGLAISERIVKEHCGTMEVTSELGGGTTFRIILPTMANANLMAS
ncbi:AAA family ATPase [Sulfidibacter corallicola]|uniref:histidine kinase n=1 Tax=Sulfidibacter corallicola TaxID=2818388 RepID=A0A8A4TTR2_SULCO|nr:AAA family ATPase [Sulfidibacter corallicola]QTD52471.1 AAA family ATPase [Sulfidibacter corallicola]